MNLGDPELEVIDPTPDVHSLFVHFDKIFFGARLASRAVVRWSKRMYSCAGVCSYEGRAGLCVVALSEPLLKLRPRKDLVETLLHEMIHAFLFVTGNDRDRDGHGPNFQSHMHRINKAAGINITIYHDFHDEVKLYQTHVWRCNGPCVDRKPYFGIVRKSINKAPGPTDFWWNTHMRLCGGTFTKIKGPEKPGKKHVAKKPMGDITKYVNNNKTTKTANVTTTDKMLVNSSVKKPIPVFTGQGHTLVANRSQSIDNVSETVRNVWLTKQSSIINSTDTKAVEDVAQHVKNIWAKKQLDNNKNIVTKPAKRTSNIQPKLTPLKTKKIDDFFKSKGKAILEDLYGKDLVIPPRKTASKPNVTPEVNGIADNLVNCPICSSKILSTDINSHIDECLNRKAIDKLSKTEHIIPKTLPPFNDDIERIKIEPPITIKKETSTTLDIPAFKPKLPMKPELIISTISVGNLTDFIDKANNTAANDAEFQNKVQLCPCCELKIYKPMEEHMEECLAFFSNIATIPEEGASTSAHNITTIDLDDYEDDALDESLTMNATGTKCPCPVCLTMIEQNDMNDHLDTCLG